MCENLRVKIQSHCFPFCKCTTRCADTIRWSLCFLRASATHRLCLQVACCIDGPLPELASPVYHTFAPAGGSGLRHCCFPRTAWPASHTWILPVKHLLKQQINLDLFLLKYNSLCGRQRVLTTSHTHTRTLTERHLPGPAVLALGHISCSHQSLPKSVTQRPS